MQHLLAEDIVGELGLDHLDTVPGQIGLTHFCGPGHHVNVRMMSFVMEGSVPTEIADGNFHRRCDLIAMCTDEIFPRCSIVVAEALCILTPQGDDVRPHISAVAFQLCHSLCHVHVIFITEQAVRAEALCTRTSGDVLHVDFRALYSVPVGLQRHGDEFGRIHLCRRCMVVAVLIGVFAVRKILQQFVDELRLPFRRRTRIGNQFYIFTGTDVLEIATGVARVFDVGTFQNQLYH